MSEWEGRLKAVATLANRPRPMDGEVYCANRTCGNRRLNRTDMTCWVCGGDRFIPASEEMLASHRFTFVTPPRKAEPEPEKKPKPAVSPQQIQMDAWQQYIHGVYGVSIPSPNYAGPSAPTTQAPATTPSPAKRGTFEYYAEQYKKTQEEWAKVYGGQTAIFYDESPKKRSILDHLRAVLGSI